MDAVDLALENALLKARLTAVEAALAKMQEANRRLKDILRTSLRESFGGLPTEQFIASIIASKFGDHLPFYRQAEIFKRQGIDPDRGTLGN